MCAIAKHVRPHVVLKWLKTINDHSFLNVCLLCSEHHTDDTERGKKQTEAA